jgi:hypothetical protein
MKRRIRIAAALAACALLAGCAASRTAAKKEEPPGLSVRLPVADAATLNMESQPPLGRPELPLSVADESRGRWLTLFELNYSPAPHAKPESGPHPNIEEVPSR